ncbi:MAG: primosomal protein N', partial [Cardiobacteriales bacterium]
MDAFGKGEIDILVGTQMVSKGLDFSRVSLVAVLNADSSLNYPDFRAEEKSYQLFTQVSGRAGRESQGQVWVQTRQPNHPVFKYLTEPYDNQLARLYQQRQESLLPPCSAQVLLFAKHQDIERATAALLLCKEGAQAAGIGLDWLWLGPVPAIIARKDGQHRVHLLIQASEKKHLQAQLPELNRWLIAQSKMLRVRTGIDVDPLWLE